MRRGTLAVSSWPALEGRQQPEGASRSMYVSIAKMFSHSLGKHIHLATISIWLSDLVKDLCLP